MGPYAAYLISGKAKNESNINLFDFEENLHTDDYNKFDLGIVRSWIGFQGYKFRASLQSWND